MTPKTAGDHRNVSGDPAGRSFSVASKHIRNFFPLLLFYFYEPASVQATLAPGTGGCLTRDNFVKDPRT